VRGFHAWLKAGRVVRKGEHGIKIVAPVMGNSDGNTKVVTIKPAYVFDVTQTQERTQRAAAERLRTGWKCSRPVSPSPVAHGARSANASLGSGIAAEHPSAYTASPGAIT